jgi:Transglutaminase-like superfamily
VSWPRRIVLATEILVVYMRVRVLLRRRTLPQTVATLRAGAGAGAGAVAGEPAAPVLARRLAGATVRTITLLPTDSRCLMRSLVLLRLLARRGLESTLVISAPEPRPGFEAHAWIEHAGEPLLPHDIPGHQALVRL